MGYLEDPSFCTLYTAVDDYYLNKLLMTYPTWLVCHPELVYMPTVIVYDSTQVKTDDPRWAKLREIRGKYLNKAGITKYSDIVIVPWLQPSAESQRERMLTGLVRMAETIRTNWYLKLDADTFANKKTGFYYDKWFRGNPCYIANPWGYTKPGDALDRLNKWAESIPELRGSPIVTGNKVDMGNGKTKVNHPRMASWVMFGNTAWTQWASSLCTDARLPFPSQDTYLSYIQARTNKNWVPAKFRMYGFEHAKNFEHLKECCAKTMETYDV